MQNVISTHSLEEEIHDAEATFEQVAIARAEAENAEERKKQIKALMFISFRDKGSSAADASERAMTTPEYKMAADQWMNANLLWRTLEGQAKAKELRFEAWRTINATERAKMNLR